MRRWAVLCAVAMLALACSPDSGTGNGTASADSLSTEEGSAEAVKSFLEWYAAEYDLLQVKVSQPQGDSIWRSAISVTGYVHPDLLRQLTPHMDSLRGDPFLLARRPQPLLREVPNAIPTYDEVTDETDVVKVTLAGQTLLYELVPHEGRRKIIAVRKPGQSTSIAPRTLDGEWEYSGNNSDYAFSLKLETRGPELRGWACGLADKGNKIDCMLQADGISLTGSWDGAQSEVNVVSALSGNPGKAQLTLSNGLLHWKLTLPPEGEHYLLPEGDLERLLPQAKTVE